MGKNHSIKIIWILMAAMLLAVSVVSFYAPVQAAELMYLETYPALVNGQQVYIEVAVDSPSEEAPEGARTSVLQNLGVYTNGYDFKRYLSMRDLAALLKGTSRQFDFQMDPEGYTFYIKTGAPYQEMDPVMIAVPEPELREGDYYDRDGNIRDAQDELVWTSEDTEAYERPQQEYLELYLNPLLLDGQEVRFYSYQLSMLQDLYMNVLDVQIMLGITVELSGDHVLHIDTENGFDPDLAAYEEDGFFDLYNGVILGDATTGEILYGWKENDPDAIASTSKLMTYMVVSRYLELGKIGLEDVVTLSSNVANLAQGWYGTIWMEAGQEVTVRDLIAAMLIVSSNESALALAEYVAGSEEAFVVLMNDMADLLGLETACFYNSNGLPDYSDTLMASRRQNRMSAADLFRLSEAVLRKYPEVLTFTSAKSMYVETLGTTVSNTSYLLYNMPDAIGLKTGTTDEAGCCLVGAVSVPASDGEHILVAAILGAESNLDRYQIPEILLTWGKNRLLQKSKPTVVTD